jgi:hypothetical protein
VKPLKGFVPRIFLQDEHFLTVAEGRKLLVGKDGWVLDGNWLDIGHAEKLRLVVMQPAGSTSLLDKALLVEIPAELTR